MASIKLLDAAAQQASAAGTWLFITVHV